MLLPPMTYPHCLEGCATGSLMRLGARQKVAIVRKTGYSTGGNVWFSESTFNGTTQATDHARLTQLKHPGGKGPLCPQLQPRQAQPQVELLLSQWGDC